MEVRLLGPLEVRLEDGPVDLGPRKQRAVMAMLALEAGRTVAAERLAEGLWGDRLPPSAAKMVQLYVSRLRRVLDDDRVRIVTRGRGYELQLTDGEVDAVRAGRLVEESRPREALALWRGEPLEDLAGEPFAAAEIRRLEELRLRAAELAVSDDLAAGRHAELIGELDGLVAANPLRERLYAQRMLALYRAHRQAEALAAYRAARAELVEQIGVEPGVELQRLHEQILAHDPALDLPAAATPEAAAGSDAELPAGTVTFLFSDIEGSTRLLAGLGERYAEVLLEHRRVLRAAFEAHDGREVQTEGDAFFVAFTRASDAITAAASAQQALTRQEWPQGITVRVRMGVHTGEATVRQDSYVGLAVHRAARICSAAHGGQILISGPTHALAGNDLPRGVALRDLGRYRLKDIDEPEHLFQLVVGDLPADFPPVAATAVSLHGRVGAGMVPPPPNRTIGRDDDVQRIAERLAAGVRLLTLTGPGGVGKTRLSLQSARAAERRFADGARFVSLAHARDADDVPRAIVRALAIVSVSGETPSQAAIRYLAAKHALLVLDNFEQVLAAAPFVSDIVSACPRVAILVTSREALALHAEERYPVSPLALPDGADAETVEARAAVALFCERARSADPEFALHTFNIAAVADICRRVDGLPLAIELAAARCGVLSPSEIAARLDGVLGAFGTGARDAPERQRTMRATIEWSHRLLDDREQDCFRRFAVFADGATVAAAEAVTEAGLDTLSGLVAKSLLVRRSQDATTRLAMLETVRGYAAERLAQSDEQQVVRERHFRHFLAIAERHGTQKALLGAARGDHLMRLDADAENIHSSLGWAVEQRDAERALRLVAALGRYWMMRTRYADALQWTKAALALPGGRAHSEFRVQALWTKMFSLRPLGGGLEMAAAEEAEAIARTLDDPLLLSEALRIRADRENIANRRHVAERYVDEALALATAAGDPWAIAQAVQTKAMSASTVDELRNRVEEAVSLLEQAGNIVGQGDLLATATYVALELGSVRDAVVLGERAVAIVRDLDDPFTWMVIQGNVGLAAILDGDIEYARRAFREELALARDRVVPFVVSEGLRGLAAVAVRQNDLSRAARLVGAAATHTHERVDAVQAKLDTAFFGPARRRLGDAAWDGTWREGAALSLEDAIAYALEEVRRPNRSPPA